MKREWPEFTPAAMSALARGDINNFMVAATPGGIEAQEAEGQKCFVSDETLPIECPREELEALGFQFGDKVDSLFVACRFPNGWSKRPTDHSMWSELIDPEGTVRGSIFYKAAFYDRRAFMRLN